LNEKHNEKHNENHEELTRTVEPDAVKMGAGKRIISLIIAPAELMQNIKAHPAILVPFLMAVVIALIAVFPGVRIEEMYTRELSNISIERYGQDLFDMTALMGEYGEIPLEDVMGALTIVSHVAMAVVMPWVVVLITVVGIFILSKIMRGKARFGQLFSMYMHVYVIWILGGLVVASLMAATGSLLDMTSLAAIFARDGNFDQLSYNVLAGIAVFPIWCAVITFIGVKVLNEFCNVKAGIIAGLTFLGGLAVHVVTYMFIWWMYDFLYAAGML